MRTIRIPKLFIFLTFIFIFFMQTDFVLAESIGNEEAIVLDVSNLGVADFKTWKEEAIVYPAAGQLIPAGPIFLKFGKLSGAVKYDVYIDEELVNTISSNDDIIECEIYNTSVAKHTLKVIATLDGGHEVTANVRTFFISKKGLGCGEINLIQDLGLSWYYNWSVNPVKGANEKLNYVPLTWNNGSYAFDFVKNAEANGYKAVLGFNEPDWSDQSNIAVQDAINGWYAYSDMGLRLGSPATAIAAPWSKDWFVKFMEAVDNDPENLRVDFIAIHCYLGYADVDTFIKMVDDTWEKWHRPIWITEFGIADWENQNWTGSSTAAVDKVLEFMEKVLPELDKRDYVERYAWFPFDDTDIYGGASGIYNVRTWELNNRGEKYRSLGNPEGYILPNLDGSIVPGSVPEDIVAADEVYLKELNIIGLSDQVYTGGAVYLNDLVVQYQGKILAENTDYTLEYKNNIGAGTANLTITFMGEYKGSFERTFTIKKATPSIHIKSKSYEFSLNKKSFKLSSDVSCNNELTYTSSNTKILTVDSKTGEVKFKNYGTATVKVKSAETNHYTAANANIKFTVKPNKPKSLKASVNGGSALTLNWKRDTKASGYEIRIATNKKFTKGKKTKLIKKNKTTSYKFTGLKKGKTYYIKIRSYKTVNNKKIYGDYCKIINRKL